MRIEALDTAFWLPLRLRLYPDLEVSGDRRIDHMPGPGPADS